MSINKYSTTEDICNFLQPILSNDDIILKFKNERIKGTELFYLTDNDYDNIFEIRLKKKKLKKVLDEIEGTSPGIKDYEEKIYINSNEEQVYNFLKKEFLFDDIILEKFKNINGKNFKSFKENNLIELGLKVGERRKILSYILSMESNNNNSSDITRESSIEDVCSFLQSKFKLPDNIIAEFQDLEINGKEFFSLNQNAIKEFEINKDIQKEILDYISEYNNKSDEEEDELIDKEEEYNYFHLIDIIEYLTSEDEYNKCLYNKKEGFIELCNFMGIDNKDNCSTIAFDQANKINLKSSTIWGSKESLLEFFNNKKMKNVFEFFKNNNDDSGGIYLLIKNDKSFCFILIWPGKMNYLYKRLEEPQKDLLLSLVRIGFSLSDDIIICLTEKQKKDFDFNDIKVFHSEDVFKSSEGKITTMEGDNYFKLGEDLEIKFEFNKEEKLKNFKLNNSSLFFYVSTKENVIEEIHDKISSENLNYNIENIILDNNFELDGYKLYSFLKKFPCLETIIKESKYSEIECLCKNKIAEIKRFYENILSMYINKIKNFKYNCEFCKNNNDLIYAIVCDEHGIHIAHKYCFLSRGKTIKNIPLELNQKIINNKFNISKNFISLFYQYLIINNMKYEKLNLIIIEYLVVLKEKKNFLQNYMNPYVNNLEKLSNDLKNMILKEKNNILENDDEIKSLYLKWKNDLINKLNEIHKLKYDNINTWYKYEKAYYDSIDKKYYYTYKKYKKNNSDELVKLYNIYKNNNEDNYLLKNNEDKKWDKNNYEYDFENYFDKEKNGILVKSLDKNLFEINLKGIKIIFDGCYDYCNNILIVSKKDLNKIGIFINVYFLDEDNKIIDRKGNNFDYIDILFKIKIVPYKFGSSSTYVLLFSSNLISLININNFEYIKNIKISENYAKYNINSLQYLVYEKILLIFFYDENKKFWNFDSFEIGTNKITKIESKEKNLENSKFIEKNGKFSIYNGKDFPILFFCYFENDSFKIRLKKILTSFSRTVIESNINENQDLNLTEGNCVINYFYHSFIKYPSLGALQYNYYNNEKAKKKIYIYSNGLKKTKKFKNYIMELKELCIKERQFNSTDIDYEFQGIFRRDKIKNYINLDELIIKFIQVIPLQIAKIKNHYFKAMSNGKDIKTDDLYEKYSENNNNNNVRISINEYANFINFGMKNSIFNFYDLPVVVLAFMGAQSIGKSTLSNELVESFFNVSGMRCTEGIWMAVSLFKGIHNSRKCEDNCKCCGQKCTLFFHETEINCICEDCKCNESCCLFNSERNIKQNQKFCKKSCALPYGHNKVCKKHCFQEMKKCQKHVQRECKCEYKNYSEKEIHICEISPYNHGFLCVSLDFEGQGTFERSLEQDIDLAMVGAALANSIILRADKTFDSFMQSRMMDWSEGSKNIKNIKSSNENQHYFGGNIIFCQKDIPKNNYEEVKKEFEDKMKMAIDKWLENEKEKSESKNTIINQKQVFGIFSKYINSPTPIFNKIEFYSTLRKELIHLIIKNVLINKSLPYYRTGTEFLFFLKNILATVDIHDYNALDNIAIDNLKKYLSDNKMKAVEIFGIYPNKLEKKDFNGVEELEEYLNSNLEKLKTSYISNSKLIINETITINIISLNLKIAKIFNIKHKNFTINLNISKNDIAKESMEKQINSYKLEIEGIKEYGLLLLIPSEYKEENQEKIGIENIRENLFSLWKTICNILNLSHFETIQYFRIFISEIIKRRNLNINKWLDNLTSSFDNKSVESIKKFEFSLEERWKICDEKCSHCYYSCVKILGHTKEHNCGLDHICHEKCQICDKIIKCNIEDCDNTCKNKTGQNMPAGHEYIDNLQNEIIHSCSHFHKCQKNEQCYLIKFKGCTEKCKLEYNHDGNCDCKSEHICDGECCYKEYSEGCKIKCSLKLGHEEEHKCESEKHICIRDCSFKNKSKGCINNGKCNLLLPHSESNCSCKGDHYCIGDCFLKDKSRGCEGKCIKPFGHCGECSCGMKHICNEDCSLKDKSRGCEGKCIKPFGHSGECNCGMKHMCNEDCNYKEKTKGCSGKCNLIYGHDENEIHNCGKKHYCIKDCDYRKIARNCKGEKCILEFDHKEKCSCGGEHLCGNKCLINNCLKDCNLPFNHGNYCDCKEIHYCQNYCFLSKFSTENSCTKKCEDRFGHNGECVCKIEPKKHKCNKNCSSQECKNSCSLIANHEEKFCICGKCKCTEECKYKNSSRNCFKKCVKNFGHGGDHLCEEKYHLCNKDCDYKERTQKEKGGCLGQCKLLAGHDGDSHFCENSKENHICNKFCSLLNESTSESCHKLCCKSIDHEEPCICEITLEKHKCSGECQFKDLRGCKKYCCLPAYHKKEEKVKCLCEIGKEGHLCSKICSLYEKSKNGCNKICNLTYNHEGDCLCSSKKDHKCNLICWLKKDTREGCCSTYCRYNVGHEGPCLCHYSEKNHICNKECSLKGKSREESCTDKCTLNTGHKENCICSSKKHICKEECEYKKLTRIGCFGICSKDPGHQGEHLCSNGINEHKCNQKCYLNNKSRVGYCNEYCGGIAGHTGVHLCDTNLLHLCNGICHLSYECHKGNLKYCNKKADHSDEHDCLMEAEHICTKNCKLENVSRGCKIECTLHYNHEKIDNSECICSISKKDHLCLEKCELCRGEIYCEFEYGHKGHHLCNREHNCEAYCEKDGICVIDTEKGLSKKKVQILKKNKVKIQFEEKSEQKSRRLQCKIKIPPKKFKHEGKHLCEISSHKCGEKCRQCDRMCDLEFGHYFLHKCSHGHINNAQIYTEENDVTLIYQNKEYDFMNDEPASIYTCYQYCKQQGRGHVHIIDNHSLFKKENYDFYVKKEYIKNIKDNLYECKCEFFWKFILKFQFEGEFDDEQKKSFNKCPALCTLCKSNSINSYCELDLWHKPISEDCNEHTFWISKEGHKFNCQHPIPCHTIFIVDKSGSMSRTDIQPNLPSISQNKKFNNRFGRLIESMDKYISRRRKNGTEDVFSLISFSDVANIIFQNINCRFNDDFNFINESMQKIDSCKGQTVFYLGFQKAKEILESIDRKKYKPIIILFSDGADQKQEDTINIVKEVSTFIIIFKYIIFYLAHKN